jgi:hypothetical protein
MKNFVRLVPVVGVQPSRRDREVGGLAHVRVLVGSPHFLRLNSWKCTDGMESASLPVMR